MWLHTQAGVGALWDSLACLMKHMPANYWLHTWVAHAEKAQAAAREPLLKQHTLWGHRGRAKTMGQQHCMQAHTLCIWGTPPHTPWRARSSVMESLANRPFMPPMGHTARENIRCSS